MILANITQKDLDALFESMCNMYARICNRYSEDMEIIEEEITMSAKQAKKFEKYGLYYFPEDIEKYEKEYKNKGLTYGNSGSYRW